MTNKNENRSSSKRRASALAKLGLAAVAIYAAPTLMQLDQAHASGGGGLMGGEGGALEVARDKTAATECGDCHMAYGPGYLPSGSWAKIMGNLSNHFGEDASLDAQTQAQVTQYYTANSPRGSGAMRITETRWFAGGHRGEVSFGRTKPYQCEKCHSVPGQPGKGGGGWGGWFGR